MLCARLTSSGRGQARFIRVVAGKGPIRVVVLVVPHGAASRGTGKAIVTCMRAGENKGVGAVECGTRELQAL